MFNKFEYKYITNDVVNVIQVKPSENSKIGFGYVVQTYHFSIDQILSSDLKNDAATCLDCPMSYNMNNGKSGGCYTHKGPQMFGLVSMIKRLKKDITNIKEFDPDSFGMLIKFVSITKPSLLRFGAYGEPIHLGLDVIDILYKTMGGKTAGYTHQWNKSKEYSKYFMASVHNMFEKSIAEDMGYRCFISYSSSEVLTGATCPAAKEFSGNKKTCVECIACNGNGTGRTNSIKILNH